MQDFKIDCIMTNNDIEQLMMYLIESGTSEREYSLIFILQYHLINKKRNITSKRNFSV